MLTALIVCGLAFIVAQVILNTRNNNNKFHNHEQDVKLIPSSGNIIVFDTETNGLPIRWNAPIYDTNNWPRIVSIGWIKTNAKGIELKRAYYIIKPVNFVISQQASLIHKISNEHAKNAGVNIQLVLKEFNEDLADAKFLVAHNIDFDYKVVFAEFLRYKFNVDNLILINQICTMKSTTNFCKIPGSRGFKYPKLEELHYKLFKENKSQKHNSIDDAEMCLKCLKELYNQKIIKFANKPNDN